MSRQLRIDAARPSTGSGRAVDFQRGSTGLSPEFRSDVSGSRGSEMPEPQAPEYGAPPQIEPQSLSDYLDVMSKSVFQSGMSWRVVDSKWPGTRGAFKDFDPEAVAAFGDREIDTLAQDTRVIRNRRKLQAVVNNAARMIELEAEHGTFRDYLRSRGELRGRPSPTCASSSASWARPAATSSCTSWASRCRRTTSGRPRGTVNRSTAPAPPARRCASDPASPSRSCRTARERRAR